MAKKVNRIIIAMKCAECGNKNYTTMKNKKNSTGKLQLKKYCMKDRTHTIHKEVKA
jgi:large subunit ribosomal protein L33